MRKFFNQPCFLSAGAFILCGITAFSIQACSPDTSSISKAFLDGFHGERQNGGGSVLNEDENPGSQDGLELTVQYLNPKDYSAKVGAAIDSMNDSDDSGAILRLDEGAPLSSQLEQFKSQGSVEVSLDGSSGLVPSQAWVQLPDSAAQQAVKTASASACDIEVRPTSLNSWLLSFGPNPRCKADDKAALLKQIGGVTLVFVDTSGVSQVQN